MSSERPNKAMQRPYSLQNPVHNFTHHPLISVSYPKYKTHDKRKTRQDFYRKSYPRQDPRQDNLTQDKPKTRQIQDLGLGSHPRHNPRQKSWFCLVLSCIVLGLVLCLGSKNNDIFPLTNRNFYNEYDPKSNILN